MSQHAEHPLLRAPLTSRAHQPKHWSGGDKKDIKKVCVHWNTSPALTVYPHEGT